MMLALLVAGVSGAWAAKTYQVVYVGLPSGTSGSYSVRSEYANSGFTDNNRRTAYFHFTHTSNSELTLSWAYRTGTFNYRYTDYGNSEYGMSADNLIVTTENVSTYINAGTVSGYSVESFSVDNTPIENYAGTITINYSGNLVGYAVAVSPNDIGGGASKIKDYSATVSISDTYYWTGGTYEGDQVIVTIGTDNYVLTNANISQYVKANEVSNYNSTVTLHTIQYNNDEYIQYYNDYGVTRIIVVTYSPRAHTMYYSVQYNATAPEGKGFSLKTNTLDVEKSNTTLSLSGTTITATNPNNNSYIPKLINWENVDDVIEATQVTGYTTKVIASGGSGTQSDPYIITINYTNGWAPEGSDLAYSTFHVESTGHQYSMPAGQVAVSLNLTPTAPHYAEESITDIVSFTEAKATEMGLTLTSGASTTVQRDDDGDGVGTETTYVSKGQWGKDSGDESDDNYYFERTHTVAVNTVTQLTIPNTVELDGQIYTVTAIQKWGFAYVASDQNDREYCRELQDPNFGIQEGGYNKTVDFIYRDNINDHRNDYLQKITFDSECPITSFGDYCFMSNNKLGEITIPKNVEYLGTGVFECCKSLKNIYFQRNKSYNSEYTQANYPDGYTKIKNIKLWTFWHCTALESIDFPDGIVEIEGTSLGSPLQYVFALINVRLPNTLEHIGPHFLCDAMSLKTLTIPASVTYINGACFHGCESLETVYLMGPASTLDINAEAGETFAANASYCGQHVQKCQFLTSSEYLPGYQQSSSWSEIDEQGKTDGSTYTNAGGNSVTCLYGNRLSSIPDHTVTLEKDKWVTIIFPYGLPRTTLVENLGAGTMVAQMTKAARDKEADPTHYMYHLTFTLIDTTNGIPAQTPYMICPAQTGTVPLYTAAQASSTEFLQEATKLHAVQVEADDDQGEPKAFVTMNGQYNPYMLLPWDFYFMYDKRAIAGTDHLGDGKAKFWRVRNQSEAPTVGGCKCYWSVWYEGIKQQIGGAKAVDNFFDEGVNAIENVENVQMDIEGIYDLQGRKLNISQDALPQGLYIVNGKKVVKK